MDVSNLLYEVGRARGGRDTFVCLGRKRGAFSVKTYYSLILRKGKPTSAFSWKWILKTKPPPNIAFSVWTAARNSMLPWENLLKNGEWSTSF